MSDFYRKGPNHAGRNANPPGGDRTRWEQPDFSNAYDQGEDAYQPWASQNDAPSFLMDEPPYGAEMQQSGLPLFGAQGDDSFNPASDEDSRSAGQTVHRRKSIDRGVNSSIPPVPPTFSEASAPQQAAPTEGSAPAGRRRRAQRHNSESAPAFMPSPEETRHFIPIPQSPPSPMSNQNNSSEYMPDPIPQTRPLQRSQAQQGQQSQTTRPQQGQRPAMPRPQGQPPQGAQRPRPQGVVPPPRSAAPASRMKDGRTSDLEQPPARSAAPQRRPSPYNDRHPQQASIKRPPYAFEDQMEEEEELNFPRRNPFVPILSILLILGLLLAGICLPSWDAESGGITGFLGGTKNTITELFQSVKNMIFPVKEKVTHFTVVPSDATAPADLVFHVETSADVTALRIVDDEENVILQYSQSDTGSILGNVTKNSNSVIWMLYYKVTEGYVGMYNVQAQTADGQWNEGISLEKDVNIAPPVAAPQVVYHFEADTTQGDVPATVTFTVETSFDVVEVAIEDKAGNVLASHRLADMSSEQGSVLESNEGSTWTLFATLDEPYEGNCHLIYYTGSSAISVRADETLFLSFEGTDAPTIDENPTPADPTQAPTAIPTSTPEPTPAPTATPAPTPEPTPEPVPERTPMPVLDFGADESALPSAIALKPTLYNGDKTMKTFERTTPMSLRTPDRYALWMDSGVLTFRGGPLRQNATFGFSDISSETLSQLWKVDVGSTRVSKSTVYGIGWPGQPAIVKWSYEIRNMMRILEEKRDVVALKEVILGGQDGKLYFLDLADGQATRDPIDIGAPSGGGVSVATSGAPMVGVGQNYGNLSGKTVDNGYHIYNLLTNTRERLFSSRDRAGSSNYTGVTGAALFDKITGTMILGSQNGILYTSELGDLNTSFDHVGMKLLSVKNAPVQKYKTLASKQDKRNTSIEASVAMYDRYVFYGDDTGVLQCVDINNFTPVWAVRTGDSIKATPALDLENDGETLALYSANTILRAGRKGVSTIRRYDARTGKVDWEYEVPDLEYSTEFKIGCVASPVVGEYDIQDLVIFTATNGKKGSSLIALQKSNGQVAWTQAMETEATSSPVAVYNEDGKAWIVQAESNGNIHLLDGKTGQIKDTLKIEGLIEASPAVYKNTLVIGTTGKDQGAIYGIELQ